MVIERKWDILNKPTSLNFWRGMRMLEYILLSAFAPLLERCQNYECLRENENLTFFKEKIKKIFLKINDNQFSYTYQEKQCNNIFRKWDMFNSCNMFRTKQRNTTIVVRFFGLGIPGTRNVYIGMIVENTGNKKVNITSYWNSEPKRTHHYSIAIRGWSTDNLIRPSHRAVQRYLLY